jgi:hypothetical protein
MYCECSNLHVQVKYKYSVHVQLKYKYSVHVQVKYKYSYSVYSVQVDLLL